MTKTKPIIYSICLNNVETKQITNEVVFDWTDRYVGREIKPNYYNYFDEINGYYLDSEEFEDYALNDLVVNINPVIENGRIVRVSWYKEQYTYEGPGRPESDSIRLTARDIKAFSKVLDRCTVDYLEGAYNELLNRIRNGEVVDYRLNKITNTKVSFIDSAGELYDITYKNLKDVLCAAHKYMELFDDENYIDKFPQVFKKKHKKLYASIIKLVDPMVFPDYEAMLSNKKERELLKHIDQGNEQLLIAAETDDLELAERYKFYAKFHVQYPTGHPNRYRYPLVLAVKNNSYDMVKLLLENGAYVNAVIYEPKLQDVKSIYTPPYGEHTLPITCAIINNNVPILKLLLNYSFKPGSIAKKIDGSATGYIEQLLIYHQNFELLLAIIPYLTRFQMQEWESITLDEIRQLVEACRNSQCFVWSKKEIDLAYNNDKELFFEMFKGDVNTYPFIQAYPYVVEMLIDKNDYDTYIRYLETIRGFHCDSTFPFEVFFEKDKKWFKSFISYSHTTNPGWDLFIQRLRKYHTEKGSKKLIEAINNLEIEIDMNLFDLSDYVTKN